MVLLIGSANLGQVYQSGQIVSFPVEGMERRLVEAWTPQIVLGLDDPTSHESYGGGAIKFDEDGMQNNHFTRYYLAATKHFSFAGVGTLGVHAAYVDYRACWFPHYRRPAAGVNSNSTYCRKTTWQ